MTLLRIMKVNRATGLIKAGLTALLLATLACSVATGKGRKLYPVDEGKRDPSFSAFRGRLLKAARERDGKFVLSVIDPQIKWSFGGDHDIGEFKKHWELESANSKFWDELIAVLSLGGTFSSEDGMKTFWAPYTFTRFPNDLDAFEYAPIIGANVKVRTRPKSTAPVIATLSYDIVQATIGGGTDEQLQNDNLGWVKIITPDGKQGYISKKYIRSPVDYRAYFRKVKGKWIMTMFIAGD